MSATGAGNNASDSALSSSRPSQNRPTDQLPGKPSTVRFTSDTTTPSQSAKPSRRAIPSSDEATPIRQSDSHTRRGYNTSDTTLPIPSPQSLATSSAVSHQTNASGTTKAQPSPPWYRKIANKYGSITLENKASVARDHLALERTFLAWLRTSLSFASIGIAITQLFRLNSSLSKGASKRSYSVRYNDRPSSSILPFSPYLGHAIPAEVLPYLQYLAAASTSSVPTPVLGPTLLDQLLLLSPEGVSVDTSDYSSTQVNGNTADKLRHVGKPLGATFIGISVVVLLVGFQRYFEAQHWIIHGKFPASRSSISLVAFAAFALVLASLVVIIVISPSAYET